MGPCLCFFLFAAQTARTEHVAFSGHSQQAGPAGQYLVGVYDPAAKKLALHDARVFQMTAHTKDTLAPAAPAALDTCAPSLFFITMAQAPALRVPTHPPSSRAAGPRSLPPATC